METIEYRTIDKSKYEEGPWTNEPDKVQWQDQATGLPCLAVRNPRYGFWCGYVGVTAQHPAFGKHYDADEVREAEVHGGLTFSDSCQPTDDESKGICHVPAPNEPDQVWWLGFDCGHAYDLQPFYNGWRSSQAEYSTLNFVKSECEKLAQQLAGK